MGTGVWGRLGRGQGVSDSLTSLKSRIRWKLWENYPQVREVLVLRVMIGKRGETGTNTAGGVHLLVGNRRSSHLIASFFCVRPDHLTRQRRGGQKCRGGQVWEHCHWEEAQEWVTGWRWQALCCVVCGHDVWVFGRAQLNYVQNCQFYLNAIENTHTKWQQAAGTKDQARNGDQEFMCPPLACVLRDAEQSFFQSDLAAFSSAISHPSLRSFLLDLFSWLLFWVLYPLRFPKTL